MQNLPIRIGEARLTRFKISENVKELGSDTIGTYIREPLRNGNYVQAMLGVPAAGIRAVFEAPDAVFEGALDRRLDMKTDNRIIRDVGAIKNDTIGAVGNILRPGKAIKHVGGAALAVLRTPQSVIMEVIDQGGGYDTHRARMGAETDYSTAA
jgi:hypothetical protein